MSYELTLKQFQGPMEKLLELIEARELEITRVSLAAVTDDFLRYLNRLHKEEEGGPALIADFLVVAAKLILIKSKALLPSLALTEEEEQDTRELESRLKLYREFADRGGQALEEQSATTLIRAHWREMAPVHTRALFLTMPITHVFYPPLSVTADTLREALSRLMTFLGEWQLEHQTIQKTVVSVEEKVSELLNRFQEAFAHTFRGLSRNQSRSETIALFLAMLQLLKDRLVAATQERQFDDIILKKVSS